MEKNNTVKLLIINQYASTPEYSSGAGERFYYLSPYLQAAGFDVTILSGSFNHLFIRYPKTEKLFSEEIIPGGKFYWVRLRKYKGEGFVGRFYSWFEFLFKLFFFKQVSPPQIVLVSSMSLLPVLYAYYLKIRYKSKLVLEVRDIWPLTPIELGGYSKAHPFIIFMRALEKFSYRKADVLVSVLPGFHRHVSESLGENKHIVWIPNAIYAFPEIIQEKQKPNTHTKKYRIIYTGALGLANAMEFVVEAAQYLLHRSELEIVIVGDGPAKEGLINQVKALKLNNVYFLPKVKKEEVKTLIEEADACIISWRNKRIYSFGVSANKYNDYMLSGKPVISASNIFDDPVLLSGGGIQVQAENSKEIAKAIENLLEMAESERNQMGENGRRYILANQTYESISIKYINVLKELI